MSHVQVPWQPEEGDRSFGTGVIDGGELSCVHAVNHFGVHWKSSKCAQLLSLLSILSKTFYVPHIPLFLSLFLCLRSDGDNVQVGRTLGMLRIILFYQQTVSQLCFRARVPGGISPIFFPNHSGDWRATCIKNLAVFLCFHPQLYYSPMKDRLYLDDLYGVEVIGVPQMKVLYSHSRKFSGRKCLYIHKFACCFTSSILGHLAHDSPEPRVSHSLV